MPDLPATREYGGNGLRISTVCQGCYGPCQADNGVAISAPTTVMKEALRRTGEPA